MPVGEDAVLARDLDRAVERHGVEVGAEEDRAGALRARDPGEQVAGLRPRVPAAVVLLDLEPELLELGADGVDDVALALRGALDLAEADEVVEQALALLRGGGSHGAERYRGRVAARTTSNEGRDCPGVGQYGPIGRTRSRCPGWVRMEPLGRTVATRTHPLTSFLSMAIELTWPQALAWRMRRHHLIDARRAGRDARRHRPHRRPPRPGDVLRRAHPPRPRRRPRARGGRATRSGRTARS